jgi:hypothetical protein
MKRASVVVALATMVLLSGCASTAGMRADAARVKAMGVSLQSMSKNLSNQEGATACEVTHESSGWITSMWTDEEKFTTSCNKDPYEGGGEYDNNVGVGS